jgi:F0F1-type ATP synthase epsilon subunit
MPTIKTLSRKTTMVYARKTAKRVTIYDVWAGFAELQKAQRKNQIAQRKAHAETESAIKETQAALKATQRYTHPHYEKDSNR